MGRLTSIAFRLPATPESCAWLGELGGLLADVPYGEFTGDRLTLTPPAPAGALPVTEFSLADVRTPEIALSTGVTFGVSSSGASAGLLELADVRRRLAGHVRRVDHTGVNLPRSTTSPAQWEHLLGAITSAATTYRYPTGEDWPFVLPSTEAELASDIRAFVVGREPRFELVYDEWRTQPEWQFALFTDLTRAELETLFPEPFGTTFPGLETIFRVVAIRHPWPGLGIRFDLCYRVDDGPTDWETGEWLVTEGGRIR
ncbi:hypothetical protein [Tenggerimyces flavus]|uniref:Uncharacterized protein n=1 Tax=Tenggerimyces flavus TaxID=1708749 RepID=A0ABV7Y547_9ACTN|nr:hypothetical protein [Tenggerimyces flavus]MBM7788513.1 hypothetical protein [Tenggerimyces flavus]